MLKRRRRSRNPADDAILHDDAQRKIGTFTQALYNETTKDGWTISAKNDRMRIFAFD